MDTDSALRCLGALAQPTRLDAFRLLVLNEGEGLPAGEIAERLEVPQNTLSTHLAILERAGLIRFRRSGRSLIYRVDLDQLRALTLFLVKDCCRGQTALCDSLIADLVPSC